MKSQNLGYLYLSLAQCSIAANVITGKYLNEFVPVYAYIGGRFLCSSLFLAVISLCTRTKLTAATHPQKKLTRRDWLSLWGQALSAGFLFNVLFLTGLNYTTATSASIIASTLPGILAILAFLILGEKISSFKILAIGLAVIGIMALSLDNGKIAAESHSSFFGDLLVFLSIIPEAYYSILAKQTQKRVTILGGALVVNVFTFLLMLPLMVHSLEKTPIASLPLPVFALIAFGGLCSVTFFMLWGRGLEIVSASTAAIFGGVMPIATTLMAVSFLGEAFQWTDATGMLCVLASLWLGAERPLGKRKVRALT